MDNRELLELAAKAAGLDYLASDGLVSDRRPGYEHVLIAWNPLTDDGDALRLAVRLYLNIEDAVYKHCELNLCDYGEERYAATRRAIVCAAAEIGRKKT